MKIIDLLNNIAVLKDVPEKIKYDGYIWEYDGSVSDYYTHINLLTKWLFEKYCNQRSIHGFLNDEIEIIEIEEQENNKIEKVDSQYSEIPNYFDLKQTIKVINNNFEKHQRMINTLIDKVNEMSDKND